jgi:hypothetical protein
MIKKTLSLLCAACALMATPALGITLEFTTLSPAALAPGDVYIESGFSLTVLLGETFGGGDDDAAGNPGTAWWVGFNTSPALQDHFVISRTDQLQFSLDSLDYRSLDGNQSDSIQFFGRLNGTVVGTSAELGSFSTSYQSFSTGFSTVFEDIVVQVSAPGATSLLLDNMSLTVSSVPEPGTALCMTGGLALMLTLSRRQRQTRYTRAVAAG